MLYVVGLRGSFVSKAAAETSQIKNSGPRPRQSRGFAARLLIGLTSAVCILLFQNCGTDFVAMSADDLASLGNFVCSSTPEQNYSKTYQPFFRKNCVGCHGVSQSPKFALADSPLAYAEFLKTKPAKVLEYASNPSHGGGAGGERNVSSVVLAQTRFDSCKSGSGSGPDLSTARTAPFPLTATATIELRTINPLDTKLEFGATNLGGAKFHFQVRIDTTQAVPAYIIARPSLETGSASVAVKAITIRINGVRIPTATAFVAIDKLIPPNTNPITNGVPNGNLTAGSAVFEYPNANAATDTIQFEFELLQAL